MCLRVLGYAREIEAKGTWPTNYMAKAHDLEILKDISYGSYNDGAKRGDTALLIWNMLRTNMWTVKSESEGDGLLSSATTEMLNVKFPDYKYDNEAIFSYYEIDEDAKNECAEVVVGFYAYTDEETDEVHYDEYTYYGNDFYTFVAGTEVEVLINKEDGVLLTMVPTGEDKLVAGKKDVIDEDYDELSGEGYDYTFARVIKKDIVAANVLTSVSTYLDDVEVKKDYAKFNESSTKYEFDAWDYEVILKDGERIVFSKAIKNGDIAEGDILTKVMVNDDADMTFYVVGGTKAEGKLTKYKTEKFDDGIEYDVIVVNGHNYVLADNATYMEDPEDEDEDPALFADADFDGMRNEEVVLKLDPVFGKVVRIEFDGEIDDDDTEGSYRFFAIASKVKRDDEGRYYISLENENGVSQPPYYFKENSEAEEVAHENWVEGYSDKGSYAYIGLNEDDEIVHFDIVANGDGGWSAMSLLNDKVPYEDDNDKVHYWIISGDFTYSKAKGALVSGDNNLVTYVGDDIVLVTLVYDKEEDEYSYTFAEGKKALEDVKNEKTVVIYVVEEGLKEARYVVIFDELSDISGNKVATIEDYYENKLHEWELELADEEGKVEEVIVQSGDRDYSEYELVVYTTEEKAEKDGTVTLKFSYVAGLNKEELNLNSGDSDHGYIVVKNGKTFYNGEEFQLADEDVKDEFDEMMIVLVNVSPDDDDTEEAQYLVDSFSVVEYDDVTLKDADRISISGDDVVFVIRGMKKLEQ